MRTITKLGPKSVANVYGFFLAVSVFLMGLGIGIGNIIQRLFETDLTFITVIWVVIVNLALGALVGLLSGLFAAIVGYISGYLIAWLYNRAIHMKLLGGIKIELE